MTAPATPRPSHCELIPMLLNELNQSITARQRGCQGLSAGLEHWYYCS
jgi:hypothetical protein